MDLDPMNQMRVINKRRQFVFNDGTKGFETVGHNALCRWESFLYSSKEMNLKGLILLESKPTLINHFQLSIFYNSVCHSGQNKWV